MIALAETRSLAFYTVADIARILQVHPRTVKGWITPQEDGTPAKLASRKIQGVRRITPEDFEAFIGEESTP